MEDTRAEVRGCVSGGGWQFQVAGGGRRRGLEGLRISGPEEEELKGRPETG
jgi:hypothetical protein